MHDEMRTLLNAYLDNELHGKRLQELELHLASCQDCREELEQLRHVSKLLQAAPAPEFTPAERFVSNLTLSLPRRPLRDHSPQSASLVWWLVPAGLLFALFFVRTVITLTDVIAVADVIGLLGSAAAWLDAGQHAAWYATTMDLFGNQLGGAQSTLEALNTVSVFGGNLLSGFLWQAGILLLLSGWLVFWWFRRSPRLAKHTAASSQS
jgi:hypothetical protein